MIVRRGKNDDRWDARIWYDDVGFSSGFTPKGKVRPPLFVIAYATFTRMTGMKLEPGEWKECKLFEVKKIAPPDVRVRGPQGGWK